MEYIIPVYKLQVKLAYLVPKLWELSGIGPNTFSFFFIKTNSNYKTLIILLFTILPF